MSLQTVLALVEQMNKPLSNPMVNLDPEAQLDDAERAAAVSILDMPGWFAVRKLMEIEIKRFDLALKNADPADREDVLAKHVIAKAASQFYVQIIDRLNTERELFLSATTPEGILPSVTDAITEV